MSLAGLGVLIIGFAFLILALFMAKALINLASVLDGVNKAVEQLPNQIDDMIKETSGLIRHSNETLVDVNDKLKSLSPLFYIVGDVGNASRKLSSSLVDVSESLKNKTIDDDSPKRQKFLSGAYSSFALGYYWLRKRSEREHKSALYARGQKKSMKIDKVKKDVQEKVRKAQTP